MMETEIFSKSNILFDQTSQTQDEAFKKMAQFVADRGYVTSAQAYYQGLIAREKETTTGFKNGIAIPHSDDDSVKAAGLFLIKFRHRIEWHALDQQPVQVAFTLTIPKAGSKKHLRLLSLIARKLMDETFTQAVLTETDLDKLTQLIAAIN